MKNVIIKYGLISGAFAAVSMAVTTLALKAYGFDKARFDYSVYFGYTTILLAMAVIFFGIRAFRDDMNAGKITFGKGLLIGLGIAVISSICYSLMWMIVYYNFIPNFFDDYAKFTTDKLVMNGASAAELAQNQAQIDQINEIYKTPFGIFSITLIEPLPVGIMVALVSAFILKRK